MQKIQVVSFRYWLEISSVALLYFATAKIGQAFAIPPGNITPVWLPSGIMLALVLIRGYHIWPGIFLGAFVGNASAYIDPESMTILLKSIMAGTANGIGDVLATVGAIYVLRKIKVMGNIFGSFSSLLPFLLLGAILGPLLSAIFGITSLALVGILSWDFYVSSLITWWVGDGVGVLLFTPLILFFHRKHDKSYLADRLLELSIYFIVFTLICSFMWFHSVWPEPLPNPIFFTVPLLLWAVLRLGFRVTFLSILVIAIIAIVITSKLNGPFIHVTPLMSIIELQLYLSIVITSVLVVGIISSQRDMLLEELQLKLDHDLLTGAWTRSCFMSSFDSEAERYFRYGTPFCLIMFDIDFFKKINDTFGHEVGDEVLSKVCKVINGELRDIDSLTRWGGEEFIILLPNTILDGGHQIAERCRTKIAEHDFLLEQQITISLGLTQSSKNITMKDMLEKVDDATYTSKRNGRNQITIAGSGGSR